MKNLITSLLIILAFAPVLTLAQIKTTDQSVLKDTKSTLQVAPKKIVLKNSQTLEELENRVIPSSELKNLPKLLISQEDIERSRTKSWEISAENPCSSGFELFLANVNFNCDGFILTHGINRDGTGRAYESYMGLYCTPTMNKDYRLTIFLDKHSSNTYPHGYYTIVKIGSSTYKLDVPRGSEQLYILFRNEFRGKQAISFTNLRSDSQTQGTGLKITKVRLEELASAE